MRQSTILGQFLMLLSFPLAAQAQNPPPQTPATPPPAQAAAPAPPPFAGPAKVAWLNLQEAIISCDEGKKEFGDMQRFVDQKSEELQNMNKELDTLKNQLNVQGSKLTDEARADLEEEIDSKTTNVQRFQQDTQKEIDSRRNRLTNAIGRKMMPIVEKISKDKGVTAVVYLDPARDAWVDPALFITQDVIKAYNAAHPAAAASAPAKKP